MNDEGYTFQEFHIPARMMSGINLYVKEGVLPGDFLRAVICNNLRAAVECADDENIRNLPAYVSYFYSKAPALCWGSRERMLQWNRGGGGLTRPEIDTAGEDSG